MNREPITFHRRGDSNWFESRCGRSAAKWIGPGHVRRWRLYRKNGETLTAIGDGYDGFELLSRSAMRDEAIHQERIPV